MRHFVHFVKLLLRQFLGSSYTLICLHTILLCNADEFELLVVVVLLLLLLLLLLLGSGGVEQSRVEH